MGTTMPPTRHFYAYADKPGHDDEATACSAEFLSNRSLILMRMGTGPAMGMQWILAARPACSGSRAIGRPVPAGHAQHGAAGKASEQHCQAWRLVDAGAEG